MILTSMVLNSNGRLFQSWPLFVLILLKNLALYVNGEEQEKKGIPLCLLHNKPDFVQVLILALVLPLFYFLVQLICNWFWSAKLFLARILYKSDICAKNALTNGNYETTFDILATFSQMGNNHYYL
ncbi:hypothetical protein PanWU01x14_037710 [Parasponia andersonii]|uniref:Uncharacterized protein n=1 Tax=Parasponia andersonii TaxID=3476 RepID=A0A2P5DRY8_PARAD|nr:hypothetical protein PanWU01x14_037710 [Parasponia andersonii]